LSFSFQCVEVSDKLISEVALEGHIFRDQDYCLAKTLRCSKIDFILVIVEEIDFSLIDFVVQLPFGNCVLVLRILPVVSPDFF